jgi:hypothetical protein
MHFLFKINRREKFEKAYRFENNSIKIHIKKIFRSATGTINEIRSNIRAKDIIRLFPVFTLKESAQQKDHYLSEHLITSVRDPEI